MRVVMQKRDWNFLDGHLAGRLYTRRQSAQARNADLKNTDRRLARLSAWVVEITVKAVPPPDVSKPLDRWFGGALPDPGPIAYKAKTRLQNRPARPMRAYVPTVRTMEYLQLPTKSGALDDPVISFKPHQASHEIAVTQIWLEHGKKFGPGKKLFGDFAFSHTRGYGEKVEDLIVAESVDKPLLSIDYIGPSYDRYRVQKLSRYLAKQKRPFMFF